MIISPTYFQEIVSAGVMNKHLALLRCRSEDTAYDTVDPIGDIVFDANHMLMLPEEVVRRGISVWSPEPKPEPPKKDDGEGVKDVTKPPEDKLVTSLDRAGEPRRALAELMVSCTGPGLEVHPTAVHELDG